MGCSVLVLFCFFFFSSRRRHTILCQVTGVQTCALPIYVPAWPVRSVLPRSSRRTIPMVDRRRELALLSETFQRAREGPRAHMVTILGEAGIGKSRLVEEFRAGLPDDARFLAGRTNEY